MVDGFTSESRNVLVEEAGQRSPSDATWKLVVARIGLMNRRERQDAAEAVAAV